MTRADARERVRAAQAAMVPPGGFDAWLLILAAPAGSGEPGAPAGGVHGGGGYAGEPPAAGRPASGLPAAGVWTDAASLTAPNDPDNPLSLFFIAPEHVTGVLARRLAHLGDLCARAGERCEGYMVQVGLSGMEYRALAAPPEGFVPRYRLPRRSLEEPVWAGDEPLWCPRDRLLRDPGGIAAEIVARLEERLGGTSS